MHGLTAEPIPELAYHSDAAGQLELRAGAELVPFQAIQGFRDYSLEEHGVAYGGFAAGLLGVTGRLWLGIGASFAGLRGDWDGVSPHGPMGGWLLHVPLLVELGFPVGTEGSRAIGGLELGGMFAKLTNVYQGHLTNPTVNLRGRFLGLRGGYVLPIGEDLGLGALLGVRAGTFDQTNSGDPVENQGLPYLSIAVQLGLYFQP